VKKVEFIKSSPDLKSCPKDSLPEYAFVGRSNVGKSSLINYLSGQKRLAKTSSQPGKTRLINHFLVDDSWYLVDLPGYGFARISKAERNRLRSMLEQYLLNRKSLICLFLLIDSRHSPQNSDLNFIHWLGEKEVPFVFCFTKTDKLGSNQLTKSVQLYKNELLKNWESLPEFFLSSVIDKTGKDEILAFIQETNTNIK